MKQISSTQLWQGIDSKKIILYPNDECMINGNRYKIDYCKGVVTLDKIEEF